MGVDFQQRAQLERKRWPCCSSAWWALFTYAILRLQNLLLLNPQGLVPVNAGLAFNTAVSFTTNTIAELQRKPPCRISHRWFALAFHNFASAATGIAIAAALVRAIARHSATRSQLLGGPAALTLLPPAAHLPRVRSLPRIARMIQNFQALHQGDIGGAR